MGQGQLPGLHLEGLGVVVRDDLENNSADVGGALEIVLVPLQGDGLPLVPSGQLVGASAHGGAEEAGGLHVLALQQVLGQRRHGHVVQKGCVGGGQAEGDGVLVKDGDLLHVLIVGGVLGAVVRVHDGLDGELHVLGGKGLAIVPLDVLLQIEGVGAARLVKGPALGQAGDHLVLAVMGGEAVEEQDVDLSVLVHGGVDPGVVAAGVNQRIACGGASASAAGCQAQRQGCREQKGQELFFHR